MIDKIISDPTAMVTLVLAPWALLLVLGIVAGIVADHLPEPEPAPEPAAKPVKPITPTGNQFEITVWNWEQSCDNSATMLAMKESLLATVAPLRSRYTAPLAAEDQHSLDTLLTQADSLFTLYKATPETYRKRPDLSEAVNAELAELGKAVTNFNAERSNLIVQELDRDTEFLHTKFHTKSELGGTK